MLLVFLINIYLNNYILSLRATAPPRTVSLILIECQLYVRLITYYIKINNLYLNNYILSIINLYFCFDIWGFAHYAVSLRKNHFFCDRMESLRREAGTAHLSVRADEVSLRSACLWLASGGKKNNKKLTNLKIFSIYKI